MKLKYLLKIITEDKNVSNIYTILKEVESRFIVLKNNVKEASKHIGYVKEFYRSILTYLTDELKKANTDIYTINKHREDYINKFLALLSDVGRNDRNTQDARTELRKLETDNTLYVPPNQNPTINDKFFDKFVNLSTDRKKLNFAYKFLENRGAIGRKNSRVEVIKLLDKGNLNRDKKIFLTALKAIRDRDRDLSSPQISEKLYNKYNHITDVKKYAKSIVKEIPEVFGAEIPTYQNYTRWMKKHKPSELTDVRVQAIKDSWNVLDWKVAEREVRDSFGGKKQSTKITEGGFSAVGGGPRNLEPLKKAAIENNKIGKELEALIRNTDFIKHDVHYKSEKDKNIDRKPIYIEVKNISSSGKKVVSALEGKTVEIDGIIFGRFFSFTGNRNENIIAYTNLNNYIKTNSGKINEILNEQIKNQIKKIPGHTRNFIAIKDVNAKQDYDFRINIGKESNKLDFYFRGVSSKNDRKINVNLNIKDLSRENLYSYKEAIERNKERGLVNETLLRFKKLTLEGFNK